MIACYSYRVSGCSTKLHKCFDLRSSCDHILGGELEEISRDDCRGNASRGGILGWERSNRFVELSRRQDVSGRVSTVYKPHLAGFKIYTHA